MRTAPDRLRGADPNTGCRVRGRPGAATADIRRRMSFDFPHTSRYVNGVSESTSESPASQRLAAKQATRRSLVDAARDAFVAEGLDGPSLDSICERAGRTRGAFYVHFQSREDLVHAVMADTLERVVDGVLGSTEEAGSLAEIIGRFVDLARLIRDDEALRRRAVRFHQMLHACWIAPSLRQSLVGMLGRARRRLASAIDKGRASGACRPDLGGEQGASLLVLMALGVVVADEIDLDVDLDATRDALLRMLAVG